MSSNWVLWVFGAWRPVDELTEQNGSVGPADVGCHRGEIGDGMPGGLIERGLPVANACRWAWGQPPLQVDGGGSQALQEEAAGLSGADQVPPDCGADDTASDEKFIDGEEQTEAAHPHCDDPGVGLAGEPMHQALQTRPQL